jgi:hypothetical protein
MGRREAVGNWEGGKTEPRLPQHSAYARLLEGSAARFPAPEPATPPTPEPTPGPAAVGDVWRSGRRVDRSGNVGQEHGAASGGGRQEHVDVAPPGREEDDREARPRPGRGRSASATTASTDSPHEPVGHGRTTTPLRVRLQTDLAQSRNDARLTAAS